MRLEAWHVEKREHEPYPGILYDTFVVVDENGKAVVSAGKNEALAYRIARLPVLERKARADGS